MCGRCAENRKSVYAQRWRKAVRSSPRIGNKTDPGSRNGRRGAAEPASAEVARCELTDVEVKII